VARGRANEHQQYAEHQRDEPKDHNASSTNVSACECAAWLVRTGLLLPAVELARGQSTTIDERQQHGRPRRVCDWRRDLGDDRARVSPSHLAPKTIDVTLQLIEVQFRPTRRHAIDNLGSS
jgi:hypothetical protein